MIWLRATQAGSDLVEAWTSRADARVAGAGEYNKPGELNIELGIVVAG